MNLGRVQCGDALGRAGARAARQQATDQVKAAHLTARRTTDGNAAIADPVVPLHLFLENACTLETRVLRCTRSKHFQLIGIALR